MDNEPFSTNFKKYSIVLLTIGNLIFASWNAALLSLVIYYFILSIPVLVAQIGVPFYAYKRVLRNLSDEDRPNHAVLITVICPIVIGTVVAYKLMWELVSPSLY